MAEPLQILRDLYASEINASISWLYDGGVDVKLGYEGNPGRYDAVAYGLPDIEAAIEWLRTEARKHYPDSEFAKQHV